MMRRVIQRSLWGIVGLSLGCSPKGAIAESSKTQECRADVVGALETFKRDLGLAFDVNEADADALFTQGTVEKSYGRDGIRHGVRFGLDVRDGGGCTLRMFQKSKQEPGNTSTTRGNYGTVELNVCRCE